jgi:hypothetical protein
MARRRLGLAVVMGALMLAVSQAPAVQAIQGGTLNAGQLPQWQTNGTVYALAVANGVLYAGGDFTSVRPPGSPAGTDEQPRNHLAAFSVATGGLLPFNPSPDGRVSSLAVGLAGATLFAGGQFTHVGPTFRNHLAAFDTKTGAMMSGWDPRPNRPVTTMATDSSTLYIGGGFTTVAGQARTRLAAVSGAGALLPWTPTVDGTVRALAVAHTSVGTRILIGGSFDHVDGQSQHKIGSVDATLGTYQRWDFQPVPSTGWVKTIVIDDAGNAYAGVESTGGGLFEGTFSAVAATGVKRWLDNCQGATQSIVLIGGYLYVGSHVHGCTGVVGGPPETNPRTWHHLVAETPATGAFQHFFPNTNGNPLGPRALTTDGTYLLVGGDFGRINNRPQQGLARFGPPPDTTPPGIPAAPSATSPSAGMVSVSDRSVGDVDDGALTYRLFRDCSGSQVAQTVVTSEPWSHPSFTLTDTGVPSQTTHRYCIKVTDGTFTRTSSLSADVTVK